MVFVLTSRTMQDVAVAPYAVAPVTVVPVTDESADATTMGGVVNRPAGNVTSIVAVYGELVPVGVSVTVPAAVFGIPDMDPSALNVSGPHEPLPSPLTSNPPTLDFNTAGVAAGNEFVVGGAYNANPTGTGATVVSAATVDLAQFVPP